MLSEGSSVKGSPEDKQASAPYIRKLQDFTVGHSGTFHPGDGRNRVGMVVFCMALVSHCRTKYRLRLNCMAMVLFEQHR